MPRHYSPLSVAILDFCQTPNGVTLKILYNRVPTSSRKAIYDAAFRLVHQELLEVNPKSVDQPILHTTREGAKILSKYKPTKDGIWKLVIFDIPESKRYVRTVLRAKLHSLGFKKWQSSIWVTPYTLDPDIEKELNDLSKKFFVRLIKTTEINNTSDLQKLFPE